jgi:hypothetical protein
MDNFRHHGVEDELGSSTVSRTRCVIIAADSSTANVTVHGTTVTFQFGPVQKQGGNNLGISGHAWCRPNAIIQALRRSCRP